MIGTAEHVGVEATRLLRERRGIGRYVRNLLVHMPQVRPSVRFTLYVRHARDIAAVRAQLDAFSGDVAARTTVELASALPDSAADVIWYPWNWIQPPANRAARVVTVLDVAPMLQLDHRWWKWLKRAKYRARYRHSVREADMILAISAFTELEMRKWLTVDPSKIRVTLLAADDLHAPASDRSATLDRLGIPGAFFLTVGAQEARKNLRVLYEAMEQLHARGERVPLVQCGPSARATPRPWLHHAGYVSDAELATLYQQATALVFPSFYEGFGLPALEAMAAGGRVVCANSSSLPEVVGDAALLFPWNDAEALATQLMRVLHDAKLREKLTRAGVAQSAKFRWATTASQTLDTFDEAMQRRARRG
jgi:glycosyltransferase involved in cell wall biosynthesis